MAAISPTTINIAKIWMIRSPAVSRCPCQNNLHAAESQLINPIPM